MEQLPNRIIEHTNLLANVFGLQRVKIKSFLNHAIPQGGVKSPLPQCSSKKNSELVTR